MAFNGKNENNEQGEEAGEKSRDLRLISQLDRV